MKKIVGVRHWSNSDMYKFNKGLAECIGSLQSDGQEVEVQYKTNMSEQVQGRIIYSALILGRKEL